MPADQARLPAGALRLEVFDEAAPVGRDVAGVADGQAERVGGVAERVDDLEGGGLLALDAVRVDGVDERDRVLLGDPAGDAGRLAIMVNINSFTYAFFAGAGIALALLVRRIERSSRAVNSAGRGR